MSDDDQRHQPNEESAEAVRKAESAAGGEAAAETGSTEVSSAGPATATGTAAAGGVGTATGPATATAVAAHRAAKRREFHEQGDGSPRYAPVGEPAPPSGSEQSWSAQPNPGYQPDPAINYPTKRVVAGTLIGALLMAGFVVYTARILTNRSGNGNGSAPWTAAVERDGAVLGGINAQNNGSAHEIPLPADLPFGSSGSANAAAINKAVAACRTATDTKVPIATTTGSKAAIDSWAVHATPAVQSLRHNAALLQQALTLGHVAAVANAADTLCSTYPAVGAVPPMPDAAGSQAWSAAVGSFAIAATESLRGASGNPDATAAAFDNLTAGNKQLDALSSRIATAT